MDAEEVCMEVAWHRVLRARRLAGAIVCLALLAGCSDDDPPAGPQMNTRVLAGTWSRINSSFSESEGTIISTPDNIYLFEIGDLKWHSIANVADGEYTFEDLARQANTGTPSYLEGQIEVSADGDSLSVTFTTTATVQSWVRAN
jgi:hypothetical protein